MNRSQLLEATLSVSINSFLKGSGQITFLENKLFTKALLKLKIFEINVVVTAYVDIMIWSMDWACKLVIDGVEEHCSLLPVFEASCHLDID